MVKVRIQNRISRPLLYEEVVSELYKMINQNSIHPGDKFPSERELTEALGISRNVLREAFHVLENRGIIVAKQGSGRYLRELPKEVSTQSRYENMSKNLERYSLMEAYEVRQVLEVKAIELIVRNASEGDIAELETAYKKLEEKFRETNRTAGEFDLHRLYAKKSGSPFMEQTLGLVLSAILDMMRNTFYDILTTHETEKELVSHKNILNAIRDRNAELAKQIMFDHIQETIDMLQ